MSKRSHAVLTIVFTLMFLTCVTPLSSAQMPMGDPPPIADRSSPDKEFKRLDKLLKLSDDQKAKLLPILQTRAEAIEKLIANEATSMRDKFPKIIAIRDRSNEEIRTLLTDGQRKKFDRMVAEEKKRMESGPEDGPLPGDTPPPPPPQ